MMRRGRINHAAAPSQYYAEPKRLERLGLLTSSKEPGRTRERTVYRLTDAGSRRSTSGSATRPHSPGWSESP